MLTFFNQIHLDIYNRCIRPIDQSIDWPSYFIWAQLMGVENIIESADYILFMRSELNKDTTELRKVENPQAVKKQPKKENALEKKLAEKYGKSTEKQEVLSSDDIDAILKKSGKYRAKK